METKTETLAALELDVSLAARVTELHTAIAAKMGWPNPDPSQR